MIAGPLIFPAIRWDAAAGYEPSRPAIERALGIGVGGFILFGGPPDHVARLTEGLRREAGRPLVFGSDLERGAGQQFPGLTEVPPPRALAALDDLDLIAAAGAVTGREARSVGVDWVYAPDADLDLEADNPIVQTRSFGADPDRVARAVAAWVRGCQAAGAIACAKHFPGHGRTRVDSHDRTPLVETDRAELARTDLVPFRAAIEAGVGSVMTAHVAFPSLDPSGRPGTRSPAIIGMLRRGLGFDGVVVTDALMMAGVGREGVDPAVEALLAGVDGLLYPADPIGAATAIERAAASDAAVADRVRQAIERIVRMRAAIGRVDPAGERAFDAPAVARRLLDRCIRPALRAPLELIVVDDDLDGAYPPGPSDWTARALERAGVPQGPGGSRVLLAFAEPRASKGRAGFGASARATLEREARGADLIVLFAHERLRDQLPSAPPVAVAWHRQRLMQEAVADWLADALA
ncbi:MAG: glycoside hydrolase family 3 N-terminal domain-containing protein [Gemmatimonadales bacterium]